MRAQHEDEKKIFCQQRYLEEFVVKFTDNCSFISSYNKALIPVGKPDHAISTGMSAYNASLAPPDPNGLALEICIICKFIRRFFGDLSFFGDSAGQEE